MLNNHKRSHPLKEWTDSMEKTFIILWLTPYFWLNLIATVFFTLTFWLLTGIWENNQKMTNWRRYKYTTKWIAPLNHRITPGHCRLIMHKSYQVRSESAFTVKKKINKMSKSSIWLNILYLPTPAAAASNLRCSLSISSSLLEGRPRRHVFLHPIKSILSCFVQYWSIKEHFLKPWNHQVDPNCPPLPESTCEFTKPTPCVTY